MENGSYPAGAQNDNAAPFNKRNYAECPTCEGEGERMFSCCTGELIQDHEFGICPDCLECLGEEECSDCEGTGMMSDSQIKDEYESHKEDMNER
tara:strand:+ start:1026 stop:1307 length:282 start_codon:yes stop_codon:yes gene_type:complete